MKFKILRISLIVIVFLFPSLCFSQRPDPDKWEHYGVNSYYNKTNITKSSDIVSVWTYTIVTDDIREKTIKIKKEEDLEKSVKYQNFDHIVMWSEIDCAFKVWRKDEIEFYDDKENVLDQQKNIYSEWGNIVPDSLMERLYNKVCVIQTDSSAKPVKPPRKAMDSSATPVAIPGTTPVKTLGKSWEYLSDNVYYNKRNVTKSSNLISVWTYNIVTDDFREQKIEAIKKNDFEKSRKYQYYDHNVVSSEINCRKRVARTKMYIDYDDAGEVLTSYTYKNREWKDITHGSPGEKLYQKLCMSRKTQLFKRKSLKH
ncbi:MAG: surface-adhesin E family protein [Smithella sp.]